MADVLTCPCTTQKRIRPLLFPNNHSGGILCSVHGRSCGNVPTGGREKLLHLSCRLRKSVRIGCPEAVCHLRGGLLTVGEHPPSEKILMCLASANEENAASVQSAYDSMILFLREPSIQESIGTEFLQSHLHHSNFLDIFFELVEKTLVHLPSDPQRCLQNNLNILNILNISLLY
ncbi:hypothetical protein KOW79_003516 [Hemibagrus wyckioides]|uniref:Uncharacterized protein n=1 Tax=Hemibagrus wyckioides TaxID=337641 RepID=A0A9D3SQD3_9TELE|nr:hypothetical protein KOW79_003516 [Hemibagrus wyckioides]